MKKAAFILFSLLALLNLQAQDYLIGFAGTGDTTAVNTIQVDNLTTGAEVTLNGGDVLHLTASLGIDMEEMNNGQFFAYPNPMIDLAVIRFVAPDKGNATISILDLTGKTVYLTKRFLSDGENSFRISGIYRGIYILKISGRNYSYTTKLISLCQLQGIMEIENISSVKPPLMKSSPTTIDMKYNTGDQLLYTGISGPYSTIVTDVPIASKTITFNFALCKDNDGNYYKTVTIGGEKEVAQIWMAENLNVGTMILTVHNQGENGTIEKYCYNDDMNNCNIYGGLYQWDEMMQYVTTEGVQGLCPPGWHLPSEEEWLTMLNFLGGESLAGKVMKEVGNAHWVNNSNATNSSGFTALPGGARIDNVSFWAIQYRGIMWTTSPDEVFDFKARFRTFDSLQDAVPVESGDKAMGLSVRCMKD